MRLFSQATPPREARRGPRPVRRAAFAFLAAIAFGATQAPPAAAEALWPEDFIAFDARQAALGRLLFYDKVLSGNRNISCATCHHHTLAGADGLSLGIGQGGSGLGPDRRAPVDGAALERIPRNAPALWGLGHRELSVLFHDGRVSRVEPGVFRTPAGDKTPAGLNSTLAAQALFPITSHAEMAGHPGENPIADAALKGAPAVWPLVADRVRGVPGYGPLFAEAFADVAGAEDIRIVHVANALAAFVGSEWRGLDTPYDDWARDGTPLPAAAERGRRLFFGEAGCASCHNGPLFTDQRFHAAAVPQFGPGRTRPFDPIPRDIGRMAQTNALADAYRFRTPSLRGVALTAPYGHNGAYPDLRSMIRHMADPVAARAAWRPAMARLPLMPWQAGQDFAVMNNVSEMWRQGAALDLPRVALTDAQVYDIEAFLNALTDRRPYDRPLGRPDAVPSGLPVD